MKPLNNTGCSSGVSQAAISLVCFLLLMALSACNLYECAENRSSDKAKKEEAGIHIDNGEYDKALDILNKLYNKNPDTTDAKLLQLLSNASSGSIGIDTFKILEIIDEIIDTDAGGFDLVGRVLGDEDGYLEKDTIKTNLITLGQSSIHYLEQIPEKTEDHHSQLGLLSLIDSVMIIGDMIIEQKEDDGKIKLTREGIRELYQDSYTDDARLTLEDDNEKRLNDNVGRMNASINSILLLSNGTDPKDNDLTEIFDDFLEAITDTDGNITGELLNDYLASLVGSTK